MKYIIKEFENESLNKIKTQIILDIRILLKYTDQVIQADVNSFIFITLVASMAIKGYVKEEEIEFINVLIERLNLNFKELDSNVIDNILQDNPNINNDLKTLYNGYVKVIEYEDFRNIYLEDTKRDLSEIYYELVCLLANYSNELNESHTEKLDKIFSNVSNEGLEIVEENKQTNEASIKIEYNGKYDNNKFGFYEEIGGYFDDLGDVAIMYGTTNDNIGYKKGIEYFKKYFLKYFVSEENLGKIKLFPLGVDSKLKNELSSYDDFVVEKEESEIDFYEEDRSYWTERDYWGEDLDYATQATYNHEYSSCDFNDNTKRIVHLVYDYDKIKSPDDGFLNFVDIAGSNDYVKQIIIGDNDNLEHFVFTNISVRTKIILDSEVSELISSFDDYYSLPDNTYAVQFSLRPEQEKGVKKQKLCYFDEYHKDITELTPLCIKVKSEQSYKYYKGIFESRLFEKLFIKENINKFKILPYDEYKYLLAKYYDKKEFLYDQSIELDDLDGVLDAVENVYQNRKHSNNKSEPVLFVLLNDYQTIMHDIDIREYEKYGIKFIVFETDYYEYCREFKTFIIFETDDDGYVKTTDDTIPEDVTLDNPLVRFTLQVNLSQYNLDFESIDFEMDKVKGNDYSKISQQTYQYQPKEIEFSDDINVCDANFLNLIKNYSMDKFKEDRIKKAESVINNGFEVIEYSKNQIRALYSGSDNDYYIHLNYSTIKITFTCDCPSYRGFSYGSFECKHILALIIYLQNILKNNSNNSYKNVNTFVNSKLQNNQNNIDTQNYSFNECRNVNYQKSVSDSNSSRYQRSNTNYTNTTKPTNTGTSNTTTTKQFSYYFTVNVIFSSLSFIFALFSKVYSKIYYRYSPNSYTYSFINETSIIGEWGVFYILAVIGIIILALCRDYIENKKMLKLIIALLNTIAVAAALYGVYSIALTLTYFPPINADYEHLKPYITSTSCYSEIRFGGIVSVVFIILGAIISWAIVLNKDEK